MRKDGRTGLVGPAWILVKAKGQRHTRENPLTGVKGFRSLLSSSERSITRVTGPGNRSLRSPSGTLTWQYLGNKGATNLPKNEGPLLVQAQTLGRSRKGGPRDSREAPQTWGPHASGL